MFDDDFDEDWYNDYKAEDEDEDIEYFPDEDEYWQDYHPNMLYWDEEDWF